MPQIEQPVALCMDSFVLMEDNERPQLGRPNASGSGNGQSKKALINLSSLEMKELEHCGQIFQIITGCGI